MPEPRGSYAVKDCAVKIYEPGMLARHVEARLTGGLTLEPRKDGWWTSKDVLNILGHMAAGDTCLMFTVAELEVVALAHGALDTPGRMLIMSINPSETGDGKHAFALINCHGSFEPADWKVKQRIVYVGPSNAGEKSTQRERLRDMRARATALLEDPIEDES